MMSSTTKQCAKGLPYFHEHKDHHAIPAGWGVEESHDGGFYPCRLHADGGVSYFITYDTGLDLRCATYEEALQAVIKEAPKWAKH